MSRARFIAAGVLALSLVGRLALAAPDDVLKGKDLTKAGSIYVLAGENEVADGLKNIRTLQKKVTDDTKARKDLEYKLKVVKNGLSQADYKYRGLNEKLTKTTDPAQHNQIIAQMNILVSQIKEAQQYKGDVESKLNSFATENTTTWVNSVIDFSAKADDVQKKYTALAADAEVKAALDALSKEGKGSFKLGPSAIFTANAAQLKKWRKDVNSESVALTMEHNVPMVDVTLNGKVTRSMVVDSGASLVCVTADLAKQLSLAPTDKDQTIRLTLADGRQVEAKLMSLQSVRVGTFTVNDIECAVLPDTLVAAEPLLGGSFLRNFIYRMDPNAKQLHLASLAGANDSKKPGTGK